MDHLMSNFEHVALQILSNLDINSLLQCRLVNKTWDEFIIDRKYIWKLLLRQLIAKGCDPDAYAKCSEKWMKVFEYFHDNPDVSAEDLQNLVYFVKINIDFWRDTLHKESCCNRKHEPYKCPLNSVLKFGDMEMIKLILSIPDKRLITCTVNRPSSPLQIACEREDIDLTKLVLIHLKDLNFTINDIQGLEFRTVFHYACETGRLIMVQFFLELPDEYELYYYGDPAYDNDTIHGTPLQSACRNKQIEVIKMLLDYSLRPDIKINYLTHLNGAVRWASSTSWKTFRFLLDYAEKHSIEIDLIDKDNELDCLTQAAIDNRLDMIKYVMEYVTKKKINLMKISWDENMNPLHWAAYEGHLDIVKYFVGNKLFKLNQKDEDDQTPIMHARTNGHQDVVDYLNRALHPPTWFARKTNTFSTHEYE